MTIAAAPSEDLVRRLRADVANELTNRAAMLRLSGGRSLDRDRASSATVLRHSSHSSRWVSIDVRTSSAILSATKLLRTSGSGQAIDR